MTENHTIDRPVSRRFTLVEIMIVVGVIGLLAAIAVPAFGSARKRAQNTRFANDVKVAAHAFEMYAIEHGRFPPDKQPAIIPAGMEEYLDGMDWIGETSIGGNWDWDYDVFGVLAGVSVKHPTIEVDQLTDLDAMIDDGDLSNGKFRTRSGGYIWVIQEQ